MSFEVKEEACRKYNTWLQGKLQKTVWTQCNSYYQAGRNSTTKVISTFPGPVVLFWWLCRAPQWKDFEVVGGEVWQKKEKVRRLGRLVVILGIMTIVLGVLSHGRLAGNTPDAMSQIGQILRGVV